MSTDTSILEAYRDAQNAQYQQQDLAQRKEEADNLLQFHRDQLSELHDYHQSDLARERALASLKLSDAYNEQFGSTDQTPVENLPQPNPQTSFIPGQNGQAPGFGVSDPQASVQQPYQRTQGIPPEVLKLFPQGITVDPNYQNRQFALQKRIADAKEDELIRGVSEEAKAKEPFEIDKDQRKYREEIDKANILARSRVEAARFHSQNNELDPDAVSEGIQDVYGGGDITKYSGKLRNAIAAGVGNLGGLSGDGKSISKSLDNAPAIDQIFNQAEDFAKKYSVDASGGSNTGKLLGGWAATAIPGTELAGNVNALKDKVGVLASNLDQNNRKNEAEIVRQQIGNGVDPKQTVQQNLENIQKGRALYAKFIQGAFHGLPQSQVDHILKTNKLSDYASDGKYGGVGTPNKSGKLVTLVSPDGKQKLVLAADDPKVKILTDKGATIQ